MSSSELVTPEHLKRHAIIYVRQSTPQQAMANRESLELQYALRNRASQYGWPDNRIEVIDADVGLTGSTTTGRQGFQQLVSRVSLGEASAVFAYDVTRLARNCSDWYQLLDLCGLRQCLIGDCDSIHDPATINGRLLLGLKGQISELELHTIRMRLNAGLLNKAQRGELIVDLPVGYVKSDDGMVEKHSSLEVQSRVDLVFSTFLELKSLGRVVRFFNAEKLLLPRRVRGGDQVRWREATLSSVSSMIRNPTYAGAYAYGKTRFIPQNAAPHKRRKQRIDQDQWKVLLQNHHPPYVTWDQFMKIQETLENNHAEYSRKQSSGVPRQGAALLQGIVYCARCGHQMTVQYHQRGQYLCNYLYQTRRSPVCSTVRSDVVDRVVEGAFLAALDPIELDLLAEAEKRLTEDAAQVSRARQQQLQRLHYQVDRAERQYQLCDPANRLVASELERRWQEALEALRDAEQQDETESSKAPSKQLNADLRSRWIASGVAVRDLWADGRLSVVQKKRLLRTLIDKVVIRDTQPGMVELRTVWKGGANTVHEVPVRVASLEQLSNGKELKSRIISLARDGLSDEWIAYQLSRAGFRQSWLTFVTIGFVARIRTAAGLKRAPSPRRLSTEGLTLYQAATRLGVQKNWLFEQIISGKIDIEPDKSCKRFVIPDDSSIVERIRELKGSCAQQGASI